MSLAYISQQLILSTGYAFLIIGIFGNTMNIRVFSSARKYLQSPAAFYFLASSIVNNINILINLISRIVSTSTEIDATRTSILWCKLRNYGLSILGVISYTYSCLATIDQFFITSNDVRLRRYSNIKWAHRLTLITVIFWALHGIPTLIYMNILPPTNFCAVDNDTYRSYVSIHSVVYQFAIPISIMVIFGRLTQRNIQNTIRLADQHADRQLVKMTVMQIFLVMISAGSFGIFYIYNLITSTMPKSTERLQIESFITTFIIITSYIYCIGNFYVFLIASSRFRQTVKNRLFWWKKPIQIHP